MKRSTIAALVVALIAGAVYAGVVPSRGSATGMTQAQADARYVTLATSQNVDGGKNFGTVVTGTRFVSTSSQSGSARDGGGQFVCQNNANASSPCLSSPNGVMEIGGSYCTAPEDQCSAVYVGALVNKDGGYLFTVLNNYGTPGGGIEVDAFQVDYQGSGIFGRNVTLNKFGSTDGRIFNPQGPTYIINQTTGASVPLYIWSQGNGDITEWFTGPGGTGEMRLSSTGQLFIEGEAARVASATNGVAGGGIAGWFSGHGSTHAVNAVVKHRLQHPIVAGGGRVGVTVDTVGATGGTFGVVLFDVTSSTTLCSFTGSSCTAAVGTYSGACGGGITAAAAADDVELRFDTTSCTGTNPIGNVFADW